MSDNVSFEFSFAPHKNYTPYAGESSDRFPFDGMVAVTIGGFKPYMTKAKDGSAPKPAIKVTGASTDEDAKGLRVISDVLAGGADRNGDDLGRQLCDFLVSSGTPVESIRKNAEANAKVEINQLVAQLVGRTAYAEIQADMYDGKETTKVINWVTKEKYDQAKLVGAHRRPRRSLNANADAAAKTNLGGAGAGTNGTASKAASGSEALPML